MHLYLVLAIVLFAAAAWCRSATADEAISIVASGTAVEVIGRRVDGVLYVPIEPFLEPFSAHMETVSSDAVSVCVGDDVCALIATDGSDRRLLQDGDAWLMDVGAAPELLRAHYGWDEDADVISLDPGASPFRPGLEAGQPFPDVSLLGLRAGVDGDLVSLAGFRGKKVVLFTWASW